MRVTFNTTFDQAARDLARASEELVRRQGEVSSGRRLNTASDDPAAAAAAIRERNGLASLDQYSEAGDSASARLAVIDSVLGDVLERLTAARTAILGGRGSTATAEQREAAANELGAVRDALRAALNTALRGQYLFSGTATDRPPYDRDPDGTVSAYRGNATGAYLDIDSTSAVQISVSADAIMRGADDDSAFTAIDRAMAAIRTGDQATLDDSVSALQRAFSRATAAQSRVGADMAAIDTQRGRNTDLRLAGQQRLSALEDANLAESITRMNQAGTAYRAALGSIGTTARTSLMDYLR